MATAIVTGASRGLGEALTAGLVAAGWDVVVDARGADALEAVSQRVGAPGPGRVHPVAGDVRDPRHRRDLVAAADAAGDLELVVNNASLLGPSPLPRLIDYPVEALREVLDTNVLAALALIQEAAPSLRRARSPHVVNVTSDASVEAYEGWGGYGSSKAALDHIGAVLATEEPGWRIWTVDPGDMRTRMHQDAFPGEDISDRPDPSTVTPVLLALIESDHPSGRLRLSELVTGANS